MLLLGNQQDRSIIDRIGTALQQRAAQEGVVSPIQPHSPEPTSSPQSSKRSASTLACDTKCKKPLFSTELFKGESVEDDLSDSDTSDQLTNEETASNECVSPRLNPAGPSPDDVFCSVPGRLSLLSSTSKYKVTVGEIQRRLSQPENLNASILGGILRRAKSKNGGKELRETLEKLGLSLPAGRRKSATVTLLTSLVEGEAQHLARDYSFIAESEFNATSIARHVTEQHKKNNENLDKRKQALTYATKIIQEFIEILGSDSQQQNNVPPKVIDPALQNELTHFSLCTHGFGTPAMLASMNACMRYVQASLECLEKPTDSFNQAQQALMMALNGQSEHFNNVFQSEIFKMATAHAKVANNKLAK